jgi:probable HAF family extracellular repeat protein
MKTSKLKMNHVQPTLVMIALALFVGKAWAQQSAQASTHASYKLTDLGPLSGGSFSQATAVNDLGLITGLSNLEDGTFHATLSNGGSFIDISKKADSGINSGAFASDIWGQVLVQSEIPEKDPNNENFCAYGTGNVCRAFLWQGGKLVPLPSLGGPNSTVSWINNRGQAIGIAETSTRDPDCYPGVSFTGTGPQVLDFEAVLWDLGTGRINELKPLPGDTVGMPFGINDVGQVVGGSGSCANTFPPGPATTPHAVLWENGSPISMGSLGGTVNTDLAGVATLALSINNWGEAAGVAALPGNTTAHAFLWSKKLGHMLDLGTVPGDVRSAALGINNKGDVIGPSFDSEGNPRAFVRKSGEGNLPVDLNGLVPADASLYLLVAFSINDSGEIVGFGVDNNGDIHGFLATPCEGVTDFAGRENQSAEKTRVILSENAREFLRHQARFAGFWGIHTN